MIESASDLTNWKEFGKNRALSVTFQGHFR